MRDELDTIIENAVRSYAAAEPSPELAASILRRAQQGPLPQRKSRRLALAVAVAVAATAALAFVLVGRLSLPAAPTAVATAPAAPEIHAVREVSGVTAKEVPSRPRRAKVEAGRPLSAPYSKEELALLTFVEQNPKEAAKVAEEQKQPLEPLSQPPITISHLEIAPLTIASLDQEK